MTQRKSYNPHTSYGRRKLREESQKDYNNLPPEEKAKQDVLKVVVLLIIIAIVIVYAMVTKDTKEAAKWLSK